jgi:hypothetical protein
MTIHRRQGIDLGMDPRGALGAQLVRGAMPLGGILAEVVEPELIGPGLIEEALEVAAEGF